MAGSYPNRSCLSGWHQHTRCWNGSAAISQGAESQSRPSQAETVSGLLLLLVIDARD